MPLRHFHGRQAHLTPGPTAHVLRRCRRTPPHACCAACRKRQRTRARGWGKPQPQSLLACPARSRPRLVLRVQDCNIVEYDATLTTKFANNGATAFWASGTYGKSTVGAYDAGCKLYVVSNAGYGALYLNDGKGVNLWGTGGVVIPVADTLNYGSALHQGGRLYSANGLYYVTVQARPLPVHARRHVCMLQGLLARSRKAMKHSLAVSATCCRGLNIQGWRPMCMSWGW